MRVLRRPLFLDDLAKSYAYLADHSPGAADRFLDEVEVLVDLLAAFPEIGRAREELRSGVRSFRVRGFSHLLFYRIASDAIVLLRVLHGSRNVRPDML